MAEFIPKIMWKAIHYTTDINIAKNQLRRGNDLCRSRKPMNSALRRQIREIYKICQWVGEDTPLIYASRLGYSHMVWGFIECAKQTNTNLHTGETGEGEVQDFLLKRNKLNQTAFSVAVENNHLQVAKVLFENASLKRLLERDIGLKVPISSLCDPEHDEFIISILEAVKRENVDRPASPLMQVVDIQEEEKVYSSIVMDVHSYPNSHKGETRTSLEKLDNGKLELTPSNNTILHLVSKFGDINYVKDIIKEHSSLLYYRNSEGETPAYVAAKEGHMDILEIMVDYFKIMKNDHIESLLTRTIDNNTALHAAIQNHHVGVVFLLIEETPKLANYINNSKESPIYLLVERGYVHILRRMLEKCETRTFEGPNGKTSLHAAAVSGSTECIKYLLSANRDLLYIPDDHSRTPLHHAVQSNNPSATATLLNADTSLGYEIIMEDGIKSSLVHIASSQGHCETMQVLISKCPGCSEITDGEGRNILHAAIENKKTEVIEYIFQDESFTYLINQKDNEGNTPIHLCMASELDMIEKVMDSRVDINVLNNKGKTPLDVASSKEKRLRLLQAVEMGIRVGDAHVSPANNKKLRKEDFDDAFKEAKEFLVVVTLIATATFAAGFTVPGGFDGNEGSKQQGMPILLKKAAFKAFMVTNTLAFSFSCAALYGYIHLLSARRQIKYNIASPIEISISKLVGLIGVLTVFAIIAMAIAFVTGIYVVLTPYPRFANYLCLIALCIIFGCVVFATRPRWLDV